MGAILEGVKVVELGTHIAAPKAARIMADWGAEVVKVEPPSGEAWRTMGKEWDMPYAPGNNPIFHAENANKKSVAINLKDAKGKEAFLKLLGWADVFITNMRHGPLKKLGIDYDSVKELFPGLVYAHFTAYGDVGPDKDLPGFDSAAFWANSGTLLEWSAKDREPFRPFPGFGDSTCSGILLSGVLGALFNRTRTGKGELLTCSLYGSALWLNSIGVIMGQPQYNREYPVDQAKLPNAFSCFYQTRDGDWIVTGTSTWNQHAPGVFKMLGLDQYLDNPSYMVLEETRKHLPDVIALLREGYGRVGTAEVLAGLKEIGLVHARMKNPREVSRDKQAWENGYLTEVTLEDGATVVLPTTPVTFAGMDKPPYELGPPLGRDTKAVLANLGYDESEIDAMVQSGAVSASQ